MSRWITRIAGAVLAIILAGVATPHAEEKFVEGLAAYDAGDYAETVRIWQALADGGNAQAQVALAGLYRSGEGVPRDLGEAMRRYEQAALQGNADAQLNLGRLHAEGTPRDLTAAYTWLSLAAGQGKRWAEQRRQELADKMTPEQLADAERRIAAFVAQ